ncbi:MAG TPA: hypothetical protein VGP06_18080 [Janthinobacterium sp.]|nr:hypothetical protein [Janthinobacterium sp.]
MKSDKHTDQGRNSAMDKTDAYRPGVDRYANQGGGKLGSGTVNSGHPANDVINPHSRLGDNECMQPQMDEHVGEVAPDDRAPGVPAPGDRQSAKVGEVKGTKGSGMPALSGAGERADDRPGRNEPKTEHASSSLNTHE